VSLRKSAASTSLRARTVGIRRTLTHVNLRAVLTTLHARSVTVPSDLTVIFPPRSCGRCPPRGGSAQNRRTLRQSSADFPDSRSTPSGGHEKKCGSAGRAQ